MEYRNAIFLVTEERSCPIYNVGEEFKVEQSVLTVPDGKAVCLKLVRELMAALGEKKSLERFSPAGLKKVKFECGGCTGLIRFEFKKEKDFATLQMKLLALAEQKARMRHLDRFYDTLRTLEIFEPLSDDSLRDLTGQLHLVRNEGGMRGLIGFLFPGLGVKGVGLDVFRHRRGKHRGR